MAYDLWVKTGYELETDTVSGSSLIDKWEGPISQYSDWETNVLQGGWTKISRSNEITHTDASGNVTDGWISVRVTYASLDSSSQPLQPTDPEYGHISGPKWSRHTNLVQTAPDEAANARTLLNAKWSGCTAYLTQMAAIYTSRLKEYAANKITEPPVNPLMVTPGQIVLPTDPHGNGTSVSWTTGEQVAAYDFVDMLIRHPETSFAISQPVLRKTDLVTSYAKMLADNSYLGRFMNYNRLKVMEPTLDTAALIDAAGLSDWYWQKQSPEVEEMSAGLYQIVQEYWGYLDYEPFLYGLLLT